MFKKAKKALLVSAAALSLGAAGVGAVSAADTCSGGTWWHGGGTYYTYSNYYHPSRLHKSVAIGTYKADSGWTQAKNISYASAPKAWFGNQTWYDVD